MRRVIVDTSVFVDFFRGTETPQLEALIRSNSVLLSPYVRLELLQGLRRDEVRRVGTLLTGIPQVPHDPRVFDVAEELLTRLKGTGVNGGLVDLLIAAQARLLRCAVLSRDAIFRRMVTIGLLPSAS